MHYFQTANFRGVILLVNPPNIVNALRFCNVILLSFEILAYDGKRGEWEILLHHVNHED